MREARYPALYQINTRVMLTELSRALRRPATLDEIPDAELDRVAAMGFDWVWLLSVWQTGAAAQRISRANRAWRPEFDETLPDLREEDIAGSGFAITPPSIILGEEHPDYYISGPDLDLTPAPQHYTWVKRTDGELLLAHERDPYSGRDYRPLSDVIGKDFPIAPGSVRWF